MWRWICPNELSGLPNASRSDAYFPIKSTQRRAIPVAIDAKNKPLDFQVSHHAYSRLVFFSNKISMTVIFISKTKVSSTISFLSHFLKNQQLLLHHSAQDFHFHLVSSLVQQIVKFLLFQQEPLQFGLTISGLYFQHIDDLLLR